MLILVDARFTAGTQIMFKTNSQMLSPPLDLINTELWTLPLFVSEPTGWIEPDRFF